MVARVNLILTMSPGEMEGTSGGGFEAVIDTMPGQHTTAPALLLSLRGHAVHALMDVAFQYAEAVPASHGVQLACVDAPRSLLKVPGGHAVLAPSLQ